MTLAGWTPLYFEKLSAFAIAYARIAPALYLLPLFNDGALGNGTLKNTIIFVLIMGFWGANPVVHPDGGADLLSCTLKEAATGMVLGVTLALPFWTASAIGELIDNQRGATIADSIDPATGMGASVMAPFVSLFYTAVFLQQGGMLMIVQALHESYAIVPEGGLLNVNLWRLGSLLTSLVATGLTLAVPALIVMFLSDVMLGLFSRFCPQVNAFSLSLSVKSIVAFTVFHFYFGGAVPSALIDMVQTHNLASLVN